MATDLEPGDYRALLDLAVETAGVTTVEAFREAVFDWFHERFDLVAVFFAHHTGDGNYQGRPSRFAQEAEPIVRDHGVVEEHAVYVREQPCPVQVVSRDWSERKRRELATTAVIWPRFAIEEALSCVIGTPGGPQADIAPTFPDRRSPEVDRAAAALRFMVPYLGRTLERVAGLERSGARLAALEAVADVAGPVALVGLDGRIRHVSPAFQRTLREATGRPDPPPELLEPCRRVALPGRLEDLFDPSTGGEYVRRIGAGERALVARYRPVRPRAGGDAAVLVSLEAPGAPAPAAVAARCRGLGLTPREVDVAALVARGLVNKQIARELRISLFTVKNHVRRIFERTGVETRTALARKLLEGRGE